MLVSPWQGTEYETDPNDSHRDEFLRTLAPYIDAGRRVGDRRRSTSSSGRGASDSAAVREWAEANVHKVSDRGRVPAEIRTAYDNGIDPDDPIFTGQDYPLTAGQQTLGRPGSTASGPRADLSWPDRQTLDDE